MKRSGFSILCAFILISIWGPRLYADEVPADPAVYFDDARKFYADVAGYHGVGLSVQTDPEEAQRLAKADALQRIFTEIGKDELFQEMCIAAWPESIRQENFTVRKQAGGETVAAVRILLDRNAVVLTEQSYAANAAALLDRGEEQNAKIGEQLLAAQAAEGALKIQEAMTYFRQAKAGCADVRTLLRKLTANSVLSGSGMNRSAVLEVTASMEQSADQGLGRIELAEKALRASGRTTETAESLRVLDSELEALSSEVRRLLDLSPFYDLPKSRLNTISLDLSNLETKASLIGGKLDVLKSRSGSDGTALSDGILLSLSDLGTLDAHIAEMKKEVEQEIRHPRLVRQEEARRKAETRRALIGSVKWVFLHDPYDALRIRWELPFEYVDEGWQTGDSSLSVTAERGFKAGFWARTEYTAEMSRYELPSGSIPYRRQSQTVAVGFLKQSLFGIGYGWDWAGNIGESGLERETPPSSRIIIYLGSADTERNRPSLMFSFAYTLPAYMGGFILPYHLNADIDLSLRLENILIIEGGASSGCLDFGGGERAGFDESDLRYDFTWYVGAAVRFPGPFAWGVTYAGGIEAGVEGGTLSEALTHAGSWKGYLQYSF